MSLFRKIKLFSTPNYENSGASYTDFEIDINKYITGLKIDQISTDPDDVKLNVVVVNVEIKISSDSDRIWVMVIRTLKNIVNPV